MRRFEVAEASMVPTLEPGDFLVAITERRPRAGDIVVFDHPHRPGFRLVKRVIEVDGGAMSVLSDNREITMADSRSFGRVPVRGAYRVLARYWPIRTARLFRRGDDRPQATPEASN